jgi:uncharacterized protein YjbI with pentapeptide repeats
MPAIATTTRWVRVIGSRFRRAAIEAAGGTRRVYYWGFMDDLLQRLKFGSAVWNHWRAENPSLAIALDEAKLDGMILIGINFSNVSLRRASLHAANLMNADLRQADLSGADLREADLIAANLTGATLTGAQLWEADLLGAILTGAVCAPADLEGALHVPPPATT